MRPFQSLGILALTVPAFLVATASLSHAGEYEPVVVHDEGNEPGIMEYQMHTSGGVISPVADYDNYLFFGEIGDNIRIATQTGGYYDDPRIELYDPLGVLVNSSYCAGGSSGCTVGILETLSVTGYYTIWISDAGNNDTFTYSMSLYKIAPNCCTPAMTYGSNMTGSINYATDLDFYAFNGAANTTVRAVLSTSGYYDDPAIQLIDPTGANIASNYCAGGSSGCSTTVTATLPMDGVYYLMIYDAGDNDTFGYNLSLNCLGGLCPGDWPAIGTRYCTSLPNSTGASAALEVMGSDYTGCNQLKLQATGLPTGTPALFFHGPASGNTPLGGGTLCASGTLARLNPTVTSDANGMASMNVNLNSSPNDVLIAAGLTTHFQCWFRDVASGQGSNLTDAVWVSWH